MKPLLPLAAALALAACSDRQAEGPVLVSVIGGSPALADPSVKPLSPAAAVLTAATAQGLVRFDGTGQIEPGLAIRWNVSEDGLFYTFRIADEAPFRAEAIAAKLRAIVARGSRNSLKPVLGAITGIVAVTPQVIEISLAAPRPNLLQLFAQPELALILRGRGSGPWQVTARRDGWTRLAPPPDPDAEAGAAAAAAISVALRGESAAHAVARFQASAGALVLGGDYADLAIARAAAVPAQALHFDPVRGLFGLAFANTAGLLGSVEGRRALAMAVDRDQIVARFAVPGWRAASTLVPPSIADLASPATPDWIDTPLAGRRAIARATVAAWTKREGGPPHLRIALPPGPGSRLLFALLASGWREIGVETEPVAADAPADLRLIDRVAPAEIASWYLRSFTCDRSAVCSDLADTALEKARHAPTLLERGLLLAEADIRFAEITPFIPIAAPLRWSLVAPRLNGYQDNGRGVHPLNHLLAEPR